MGAIGLLDIPPEIQLQIAEFVKTRQTLKALSVTSRSLRSISQSILFKNLQIDLAKELRGSVDDLLANPRICAAIRFLSLRGRLFSSAPPRNDEEQFSLIQKLLPEMVGLRKVSISFVNLSKKFLDAFLGIAANMPLQIHLGWNIYPYSVFPTPHTRLQISHLHCSVDYPQLEFCRSMLRASATTLTDLNIQAYGDGLMKLADIDLPFLHDFTLSNTTEDEVSGPSAGAFLTAQVAIERLVLGGKVGPLPPIPPDALPNLRELKAPPELVNQLVPGRPVEAIEITFPQRGFSLGCDPDWFGEEVGESTARVRRLRLHLNTAILDTLMVKRMVVILPFLENLWLREFVDAFLDVIEVLISLRCLKNLGFHLLCREGDIWVDPNTNDIAAKLRKANPSFSSLEIWSSGGRGWKIAISVWSEVFGVFHQMESASARSH